MELGSYDLGSPGHDMRLWPKLSPHDDVALAVTGIRVPLSRASEILSVGALYLHTYYSLRSIY